MGWEPKRKKGSVMCLFLNTEPVHLSKLLPREILILIEVHVRARESCVTRVLWKV